MTLYTCPMHQQIRETKPGWCPICGMALESLTDENSAELADMKQRFVWAFLLTLCLHFTDDRIIQASLATLVVFWMGFPFFQRGINSFITRKLNMFSLISLGVGTAYFYSLLGSGGLYFDAASVIILLVLLGQLLELKSRSKTTRAIKELLHLTPRRATKLFENGQEEEVNLEDIRVGDTLRVKPGEKVPVDGKIVEGRGVLDESMITGESMPVEKGVGGDVIGGTINTTSSFQMVAERLGADTMLSRIVKMAEEAIGTRAPIQNLADTVSAYFVPIVLIISLVTFAIWMAVSTPSTALEHAVSVLIIACPCALGLATPMSITVAIGLGARSGILIKDAKALETMAKVDTLVVDKTGTLTEGKIEIGKIENPTLLALAASLERSSEHPLAKAIVAKAKDLPLESVDDFSSIPGKGVTGWIHGKKVALGNQALLHDLGIKHEIVPGTGTTIYVVSDGKLLGHLTASDRIKQSTPEAIAMLHKEKLRLIMLTGDTQEQALAINHQLQLDEVVAKMLPEDKIKKVIELQQAGSIVAMAGDGINDAPALMQADVGIAMGTGTDVAMESAGITLVKGDLRGIFQARKLSRECVKNIRQNLFFAFLYNSLSVPIAAGLLYPWYGISLSPIIASLAMVLSSLSVVINSLRLRLISFLH